MRTVLIKIKKSYFSWYFVAFFNGFFARTLSGYDLLRKKKIHLSTTDVDRYIPVLANNKLKSFIKHCQQLPPRPVLFPDTDKSIDVSIIIPVYNQWKLTQACINSILETCDGRVNYELILADDCSTDDTINADSYYPGLIIVKTDKNVGFLRNCNNAARKARGRHFVLLNNDTIVLPNWLAALYDTMEKDDSAAIVGSKILNPGGTIQEAGAVLFRDASDFHVGKGRNRLKPIYNIRRETDYIAGCSILIRKSFWDSVGGFDLRYEEAYFEDIDIAMTARAQGMRVIYEPCSELIHFQHKSYSFKAKNRHNILSNVNKKFFLEKWAHDLENHAKPNVPWQIAMGLAERTPSQESCLRRASNQLNILYYSPYPTYPVNHGNRARMCRLVQKFEEMGHKVHFVLLEDFKFNEETLKGMRTQFSTVDVIPCKKIWFSLDGVPFDGWYTDSIGEHIRLLCNRYDIDLVLCSYVYQSKLLEVVPHHILKVIDTHDKKGNCSEMLRLNKLPSSQFSCTSDEEGAYLRRADRIIGITDDETQYFDTVTKQQNAITISHVEKPNFVKKEFLTLGNVGIVASNNCINIAMVQQCLESINLRSQGNNDLPFKLHIAGGVKEALLNKISSADKSLYQKNWVKMHGFVPNISDFYAEMDLILSPMMCGTGINIKMVEAMAHGLPLLTTVHGSRGMGLNDSMHNHTDINSLVNSLFTLIENPEELERLAELSRKNYIQFYGKNENNYQDLFVHPKLSQ